jgi:hypothetical protein
MAESEDLDESSDLSETESECYSYCFIVKVVFFKYVDANDLLKIFSCSNFKKFILTLERYYLAII